MTKTTWTILGIGRLVFDLVEAIHARGDELVEVVLNQTVEQSLIERLPKTIRLTQLKDFTPQSDQFIFGFVNPAKEEFLSAVSKFSLPFGNLIHPFSSVASTAHLGVGNFIGAGVVVGSFVQLGDFNYVNRCASLGHDTQLKNHNHIGPGATIPGGCVIGNKNMLGANSCTLEDITLGNQVIIGAGAVVTKNIAEPGTYVGVPAKKRD